MFCDNCKLDKLVTDFINNQKFCYQCMYRINVEKVSKKRTPKVSNCRGCGEAFVRDTTVKKRQRTVFCSRACALKGHKKQIKNHWTRKIRREQLCK